MKDKKFKGVYGKSKENNFKVIDTIGVPHSYGISAEHLKFNEGMYLNIEQAESKGAVCFICKRLNKTKGNEILSYKEHKQVLLIECKKEIKDDKEIKDYLLKIKDKATKNNYVGFCFLNKIEGGKNE